MEVILISKVVAFVKLHWIKIFSAKVVKDSYTVNIRLCKWLKQLDSKLSPVKGFMGSNPLSTPNSIIHWLPGKTDPTGEISEISTISPRNI